MNDSERDKLIAKLTLECKLDAARDNRENWPLITIGWLTSYVEGQTHGPDHVDTDYIALMAKDLGDCTALELLQRMLFSDAGSELMDRMHGSEDDDGMLEDIIEKISDDDVKDDVEEALGQIDYEESMLRHPL